MNYSYEMKYGDGKQVKPISQNTTDYTYFENILDINTYFGDNIYLFTQLEYSNPPVFGYNKTGLDSMLSAFYIEYSHNKFNLKLGDLYELYGRGLTFYTLQDQNIDYDNSIKGVNLKYLLKENLEFSTLIGKSDYAYRSRPIETVNNRQFNLNVMLGSVQYEHHLLGSLQYLYYQNRMISKPQLIRDILNFDSGTELGQELDSRYPSFFQSLNSENAIFDTSFAFINNFNWNLFLNQFEIYIDKSWINYDKIYGDEVFGSRFYTSIYTEIFETGITYEYKNYYTPYLIKSISNPPIVYRESNSILASRNAHSINFGNEVGHQIDFNKNINRKLNILGNLSISHRHQKEGMADLSFFDFMIMEEDSNIYAYYPFRQMYMELNGWAWLERLYYKIGLDYFTEFIDKNTYVFTLPTQWVLKLTNGSSLTTYMETQKKTEKESYTDNAALYDETKYTNYYLSVSYSHQGKWVVTGFYDQELKDSNINMWMGGDISYKLTTETQVSIFYGSQKGGLVCANGICAEQPGFEDGFKITFRSLF